MRNKEATQKFRDADRFYKEGKYADALAILDELEDEFPNTKNVMYPRALCLRHLGQPEKAKAIAERLVKLFNDPRAKQLLEELEPPEATPVIQVGPISAAGDQPDYNALKSMGISGVPESMADFTSTAQPDLLGPTESTLSSVQQDLLGPTDSTLPPPLRVEEKSSLVSTLLLVAGVIAVVAVIGVAGFYLTRGGESGKSAGTQVAMQTTAEAPGTEAAEGPAPGTQAWEELHWDDEFKEDEHAGSALQRVIGPTGLARRILLFAFALPFEMIPIYLTLLLSGKLPGDTFGQNIGNVAVTTLNLILLNCIPCIGFFLGLYMLYKVYDFGFLDFLIFFAVGITFNVVWIFVWFSIMFA
ncbi:MAG: tetratricopeptide repeat protein [Candidatus Hydrogenedentes bacterium]|nr:tetratricopeptide repeat protein [Candidatus Hydrogenedentota bacterium]